MLVFIFFGLIGAAAWHVLGISHRAAFETSDPEPVEVVEPVVSETSDEQTLLLERKLRNWIDTTPDMTGRLETTGSELENRYIGDCIVGSNPTPSATAFFRIQGSPAAHTNGKASEKQSLMLRHLFLS